VKRFVSFKFLNLRHSVGLLGRVISPSQGRYLTQTQNKHRQTSRVGFEPTIPAFDRAKTVHVLDRAANMFGTLTFTLPQMSIPTPSFGIYGFLSPFVTRFSSERVRRFGGSAFRLRLLVFRLTYRLDTGDSDDMFF
jgi:hypothetical protein